MHKKNLLTGIKKTKEAILLKEKKQRELLTRLPEIAKLEKMEEDKVTTSFFPFLFIKCLKISKSCFSPLWYVCLSITDFTSQS